MQQVENISSGDNQLRGRILLIFCLLFAVSLTVLFVGIPHVRADTEVGGPITSDTTWTLSGSPYIVATESVSVTQGVTLTIEPGVVVRFNPGLKLWVDGTLDARGTDSDPIIFTSNLPNPIPGSWGNIDFTYTDVNTIVDDDGNYISGSILQHCIIEYAGLDDTGFQNAVYVENNSMMVDSCRVENNWGSGVLIYGDENFRSWVTNNIIRDNRAWGLGGGVLLRWGVVKNNVISNNKADGGQDGGGIYAENADIIGNTITGNITKMNPGTEGGGIYVKAEIPGTTLIQGNTVEGNSGVNYGGGIYINANHAGAEFTIEENFISNNSALTDGGGIYIKGSKGTVTIQDNIISNNIADSDDDNNGSGGGIYCDHRDGTHILQDNVITENSAGDSGGGIFTDICTITGNLVSNNSAVNTGGGIVSSGDVLSNTISANSLISSTSLGAGVYLEGNGEFLYNSVVDNTGISGTLSGGLQITGTPIVNNNNLYGNFPYNVVVDSAQDISGTLNYWGTIDIGAIQESIYDGNDDPPRGDFIFDPFLEDPEFEVPLNPPTGLTATLTDDQVDLEWDEPNQVFPEGWGYNVYYDIDSSMPPYEGTGLIEGDSPIDVGEQITATLSGLEPYIPYYFAVTVYDNIDRESSYAVVIVEQPEPEPEPTPTPTPSPTPDPFPVNPVFYLPIIRR